MYRAPVVAVVRCTSPIWAVSYTGIEAGQWCAFPSLVLRLYSVHCIPCSVFFHALCSILYAVRSTPRSPFPSDSHNYLLCPSLESRSTCAHSSSYASRRVGSCNSWELGSVVLGDTMRYRLTEKGATRTNTFPVRTPAIYQWLDSLHSLQESFGNYGVVTHIFTQRLSRVYSRDSEITWKFISGIDRCE